MRARTWILILLCSFARVVAASPTEENLAAALRKFEEGKKAYDAHDYVDSLAAFQASYALSPSPNSRLFIARCYRALGKIGSAYTAFRFAAREAQDRLRATGEARYAPTRDTSNAEAAALENRVPRVTLVIKGEPPPDLVIKRNGAPISSAGWNVGVEVDPGPLVIEATAARLVPFNRTLTLVEGQQISVDVPLMRRPTAVLKLHFKSRPSGLSATLDGEPLDPSSAGEAKELDVGEHSVIVSAPGHLTKRWTKLLTDGSTTTFDVNLATTAQKTSKALFFALGGVALASLAAGTGLAVAASSEQSDELKKNPYDRSSSTRGSIRGQAIAADVLFVAGAALGIGAIVVGVRIPWKSDRGAQLSLNSYASTNGAGAGLHVSF